MEERGVSAVRPEPQLRPLAAGAGWQVAGDWTLARLAPRLRELRRALATAAATDAWELDGLTALDSAGALLLLEAWGGTLPAALRAPERERLLLEELAAAPPPPRPQRARPSPAGLVAALGDRVLTASGQLGAALALLGQLLLELVAVVAVPPRFPARELSATLYKAGLLALPITGLVGLLIGVVLSYLSALQLKLFGAETFIVDLVGLATARELGPLLAAILVAGRSGSAMTAELGVMRLTEELDALRVMGVSPFRRLILPKVLALGLLMPLVAFWTSLCGIVGGMLVADLELGLTFGQFLSGLPGAIPLGTYWLSLWKSLAFGLVVGVVACFHGLRVQPNTASLGAETTRSVVASITMVIVMDALFAVAFRDVGWYG